MAEVLHVFKTYYPDTEGGVEKVIKTIAALTKEDGFHHSLLTLSPNPNPPIVHFDEIDVYRAPTLFAAMSCPVGGLRSLVLARRLIAQADIVVWHYPWPFGDLLSLMSPRKPSIILYHSDIIKQKRAAYLYEPLRRLFFRRADRIVATSPQYAASSAILAKESRKKLRTIALAVAPDSVEPDTQVLETFGLGHEPYVLFVGALRYYKGLHTLIEAASRIPTKIVIAGIGRDEESLKQLAHTRQAGNVIFAGKITDAQKRALLEHATVFAFPSCQRSEAFGMALAEAAMYGVPMVSCSIGTGTSFVNRDGDTGLEVPAEDPQCLSAAICQILNDAELREQLSLRAKAHWEKSLSPMRFQEDWTELFHEVLPDHSGGEKKKPDEKSWVK